MLLQQDITSLQNMTSCNKPDFNRLACCNLIRLLKRVDKLQEASKINNLQQVCGIFCCEVVHCGCLICCTLGSVVQKVNGVFHHIGKTNVNGKIIKLSIFESKSLCISCEFNILDMYSISSSRETIQNSTTTNSIIVTRVKVKVDKLLNLLNMT